MAENFRKWQCTSCGFIYDESLGLPEQGIPPGTKFEDLPDDWTCPECDVSKSEFDVVEF